MKIKLHEFVKNFRTPRHNVRETDFFCRIWVRLDLGPGGGGVMFLRVQFSRINVHLYSMYCTAAKFFSSRVKGEKGDEKE